MIEAQDFPAEERQKRLIDACVELALYFKQRYPQVDSEGRLHWYFAGSLASVLLSRTPSIDIYTETDTPDIKVIATIVNPAATRAALTRFARPIGDIDYIPTLYYQELWGAVQDSFNYVPADEYQRSRARYLSKGSSIQFAEIPDKATPALREERVVCDPQDTFGTTTFAGINIGGESLFIARPDTIIGYKILHILQSYNNDPLKFNNDFAALLSAISILYPEDELVKSTLHILRRFEESLTRIVDIPNTFSTKRLPQMIRTLLGRSDLQEQLRSYVLRMVVYDQNHDQVLGKQT